MDTKLTRMQVAQMLHVTPKTLAVWERTGRIPAPERNWRGWRLYDVAAVNAIRALLGDADSAENEPDGPVQGMQVSARNRLQGVVKSVVGDGLFSGVTLELPAGQEVVAVITRSSVERLGLKPGVAATALIKSTEVLIAR